MAEVQVRLTERLWGPATITARNLGKSDQYAVTMRFHAVERQGYSLAELTYAARDGQTLTAGEVNLFPVAKWQEMAGRANMAKRVKWQHPDSEVLDWFKTVGRVERLLGEAGGRLHPTKDVLTLVAAVSEYCQVMHYRPIKNIERIFRIPNRTASYWVKLSKDPQRVHAPEPLSDTPVSLSTEEVDQILNLPRE